MLAQSCRTPATVEAERVETEGRTVARCPTPAHRPWTTCSTWAASTIPIRTQFVFRGPVAASCFASAGPAREPRFAADATSRWSSTVTPEPDPFEVSDLVGETYDLASNLPDGEHTIEVYRRTEASNGPTVVVGVEVDGEPLSVPRPTRQLEIVGDSWSTGEGVDDSAEVCDASAQNHFVTWGAIAARAVDAELSTVAWTGKGIVRDAMQPFYDRVIGTEAGSTGTIRPVDAVFVSLGANDFVAGELPDGFVPAYVSLLEQIRLQHPDALIACIWPQLPDPSETALARSAIDAAIAERTAAGDTQVTGADLELDELVDLACDNGHPGPQTHALMAEKTIDFLSAELGW